MQCSTEYSARSVSCNHKQHAESECTSSVLHANDVPVFSLVVCPSYTVMYSLVPTTTTTSVCMAISRITASHTAPTTTHINRHK